MIPPVPLKKFALIPSERLKPCPHLWSWSGSVPCTGYQWCQMCGTRKVMA